MAPLGKRNVHKERRTRSRSPATQGQPIRIREELPSRTTRRSSLLSSHDHRIPIDCPLPSCNATTVHQHYNHLQFFNPHPANEIRYRGYASSHRITSLQPDFANGGQTMGGQETFGPEISDEEEVAQEQDENGQTSVTGDDETDDQEEPIERCSLIITLRVAAPEERNDAERSVDSAKLPQEQQDGVVFDGEVPEEYSMMDEGISDPSPGDPITSRRTLDFVEDLVTPLQTLPMEIDYKTIANALASRGTQEQPDEPPSTTSPELQSVFGDWLVPNTPEQASEPLPWDIQSLDDPLHHLNREDGGRELPSNMMRPSPTPYMQQSQSTPEDDDFAAILGHSSPSSEMD